VPPFFKYAVIPVRFLASMPVLDLRRHDFHEHAGGAAPYLVIAQFLFAKDARAGRPLHKRFAR
jgi:hypothetical protein